MMYTAPELLLLITAVGAAAVSIITAWRTSTTMRTESDKTNAKVDTAIREGECVNFVHNDRATKQDAKISELQDQIKVLIKALADADQQEAIRRDRETQVPAPLSILPASTEPIEVVLHTTDVKSTGEQVATKDDIKEALKPPRKTKP